MTKNQGNNDRMRRAYRVSGRLFREKLAEERPEEAAELGRIEPAEVVVVQGQYDHMHRVLEATGVPYLHVSPETLPAADWQRMQVLFVNCPGQLPAKALRKIGPWVRDGGFLVTTDWALKHVIEPVFPGTLRHNGAQTADCVVRVAREKDQDGRQGNDLLDGFLEDDRDPLWWLEAASYPIEVLDEQRVQVLVRSGEVGREWGQAPVVVTFEEGEGTVLHMLSHLYLQRSDVRDTRDAQSAASYLGAVGALDLKQVAAYAEAAGDLNAAELDAALKKAKMMSGFVLSSRKKRQQKSEG